MLGWAEERNIALVLIQPGRPMQNGHVESFHGRLRDECLNAHWFRTLNDVRITLAAWRQEYYANGRIARWVIARRMNFGAQQAMQMWKAKSASQIRTASAATRRSRRQTLTGKSS